MNQRRIQNASFSISDIARSDIIIMTIGAMAIAIAAGFAVASNANSRVAADATGAARLLLASSTLVLQGTENFTGGGSVKLGQAAAGFPSVKSSFNDLGLSAGSFFILPSLKRPSIIAYSEWERLRASLNMFGQVVTAASELSDGVSRNVQPIAALVKKIESSGRQSTNLAKSYESATNLMARAETGFGLASFFRVTTDLQTLVTDLGKTEFRADVAFVEPLLLTAKSATGNSITRDQLTAAHGTAEAAKAAAISMGNAAAQSSASMMLGVVAAVLVILGGIAIAFGLKGAAAEFSRRFTRSTQLFRATESARIELVKALREAEQNGFSRDIEIPQNAPQIADIAHIVNSMMAQIQDSVGAAQQSFHTGVSSANEAVIAADSLADIVSGVIDEMADERKSLDAGEKSSLSISMNAEALVSASMEASIQSSDATRVAQDAASRLDAMREGLQDTSKRIKRLGERTQEISGVVESLEVLSEQIAVLALNAELEAERAGDAGAGFRMVAREVKALARRSETALETISSLVQGVQSDARSAAESVERSTTQVVSGANVGVVSSAMLSVLAPLAETIGSMARELQSQAKVAAEEARNSLVAAGAIQTKLSGVFSGVARIKAPVTRVRQSMDVALAAIAGVKPSDQAT